MSIIINPRRACAERVTVVVSCVCVCVCVCMYVCLSEHAILAVRAVPSAKYPPIISSSHVNIKVILADMGLPYYSKSTWILTDTMCIIGIVIDTKLDTNRYQKRVA